MISFPSVLFTNIILICFVLSCSNNNIAMANDNILRNIYSYSHEDIECFLNNVKADRNYIVQNVARNSSGTNLYIQYTTNKDNSKILIVSADGQSKEINAPAKVVYLNDNAEIVAWSNNLSSDIQFKNGEFRNVVKKGKYGSGGFCIDQSGSYFAIENQSGITDIASVDNPNQSVFQTQYLINKIFVAKKVIYLFSYDNVNYSKDNKREKIICQILTKKGTRYELEEQFNILRISARSSPFFVVDMDLEFENILIKDVRDNPFSFLTSYYLYDIKKKYMHKIDKIKGQYIFYLTKDILSRE